MADDLLSEGELEALMEPTEQEPGKLEGAPQAVPKPANVEPSRQAAKRRKKTEAREKSKEKTRGGHFEENHNCGSVHACSRGDRSRGGGRGEPIEEYNATLDASIFNARAMATAAAARRTLWLRAWQADAKAKSIVTAYPFHGSKLFRESLDKVLVETRDKKRVMPRNLRRTDRWFSQLAGMVSPSKKSISHVLSNKKGGNIAVIVIGGSRESLDARPGSFTLYLLKRKGFIKIALEHGAQLVPVFSFGENELFNQIENPKGSRLRAFQETMQNLAGFTLPLFHGRGIFQHSFGLMPYRKPINTVVGEPLAVKQNPNPTPEEIDQLHEKYLQELQKLFDKNKKKYGIPEHKSLTFV